MASCFGVKSGLIIDVEVSSVLQFLGGPNLPLPFFMGMENMIRDVRFSPTHVDFSVLSRTEEMF